MRAFRNLIPPRPHLSLQVSARCRTRELSRTGRSHKMISRALFFFERTSCRLFRGRRLSNLLRWTRRRRVKPFGSAWLPLRHRKKNRKKELQVGLSVRARFLRSFHRALQPGPCRSDTLRAERSRKMKNADTIGSVLFLYTNLNRGRGDAHRTAFVHKTRWQS